MENQPQDINNQPIGTDMVWHVCMRFPTEDAATRSAARLQANPAYADKDVDVVENRATWAGGDSAPFEVGYLVEIEVAE